MAHFHLVEGVNANFGVGLLVDAQVGLEVFVNTPGRDRDTAMVWISLDPSIGLICSHQPFEASRT